MKEMRGYIIVGIITAIIIYMLNPYIFANRVEIIESSNHPMQNKTNGYSEVFKKLISL